MIETTYTLTKNEFVEAAKAYCRPQIQRQPGNLALQIFSGLFLGLATVTLLFDPLWLRLCLMGSLTALMTTQFWRKRAVPVYQASEYAQYNEEVYVRFAEDGLHSEKASLTKGWVAWTVFSGCQETENVFILGMKLSWIPIPKAAFDQLQQNELRILFRSKIAVQM